MLWRPVRHSIPKDQMRMKSIRRIIISLLLALVAGSASAAIKGDVNNDGFVSITDVTIMVDIILGNIESYDLYAADINDDGTVSVTDVTLLVNMILEGNTPGTETGDFSDEPPVKPAQAPRHE